MRDIFVAALQAGQTPSPRLIALQRRLSLREMQCMHKHILSSAVLPLHMSRLRIHEQVVSIPCTGTGVKGTGGQTKAACPGAHVYVPGCAWYPSPRHAARSQYT